MDLLEYQGKQFLARAGLPATLGVVARTVDEAVAAAGSLGYPAVAKAQVRVGGRGKAGGIKVVADADAMRAAAEAILGMDIRGHAVRVLLVERASDIAREYYASVTFDRAARLHLAMLSARGGVDIEEVAAEDPDAIVRLPVNPLDGLTQVEAGAMVEQAGLDPEARTGAAAVLVQLYDAYVAGDAELVEVNPLVLTGDGRVMALDAKVSLDDNAAYRHPEWDEWRDADDLDPREARAREKGLNYVGLDGTVGVIGNGAGLVMSTLDVVSQVGGSAANFLDVGGGASADVIAAALDVVNSDDRVRAVFVNIFGGITRGEEVAKGILEALERVDLRSPIVVRLDGTNAEEGRALLAASPSDKVVSRPTMLEAASTAVALARQASV
ncbi:MAG: ADP-forming succinate--CoA ligase subunit beta [Actinomycetota bacterium]|nr:ADP-forming succinate--CoA ligase subunit beta [Actinomycetota bacterium]